MVHISNKSFIVYFSEAPAADGKSYRFSNFEQAMIESNQGSEAAGPLLPPSRNQSTHASQHSRRSVHDDAASVVKSIKSSVLDDDHDTDEENRKAKRKGDDEESIANHYSNNSTHKTWQDSLDQNTKSQVLDEFKKGGDNKRRPPQPLPERATKDDMSRQHRRPGKRDTTLQKQLARSNPELNDPSSKYASINKPQPKPRPQHRPGKKPIDKVNSRSQPDLNRELGFGGAAPSRAPSFLRATETGSGAGDHHNESDNESFQDVLAKEKTKRELERDLETNRYPPPNPYAPPPYDYHGAPPAYTASESDDGEKTYYDNVKTRYQPPPPVKRDGYPKFASRHSMPPQPVEHEDFYDDEDDDDTGDMTLV